MVALNCLTRPYDSTNSIVQWLYSFGPNCSIDTPTISSDQISPCVLIRANHPIGTIIPESQTYLLGRWPNLNFLTWLRSRVRPSVQVRNKFGCLIEHHGFRQRITKWTKAILEQNTKVINMCTWRVGTYWTCTKVEIKERDSEDISLSFISTFLFLPWCSALKLLCFILYFAVESCDAQ